MTSTDQKDDVKEEKGRKVEYGILAVRDELPDRPAGQGRPSPLMAIVEEVMNDKSKVGKAVCVAVYESKTAGGAAANVLRQRFGRTASARGVEFATRKHTVKGADGEIEDRHGLWVISDPSRIESGEWEKHQASEAKRLANLEKKRQAKAAENGGAETKAAEAPKGQSGTQGQKAPARA